MQELEEDEGRGDVLSGRAQGLEIRDRRLEELLGLFQCRWFRGNKVVVNNLRVTKKVRRGEDKEERVHAGDSRHS